jgi:hypothetical protein
VTTIDTKWDQEHSTRRDGATYHPKLCSGLNMFKISAASPIYQIYKDIFTKADASGVGRQHTHKLGF